MKKIIQLLSFCAILISFTACTIDEDYDLENLDDSITIFQEGIEMPIGSTGLITLEELLDVDDDNSNAFLGTNENGDYIVNFSSDAYKSSIEVPIIDIDTNKAVNEKKANGVFGGATILDKWYIPNNLAHDIVLNKDMELPSMISKIEWIDTDAEVVFKFIAEPKLYLEKGLKINIPDCFVATLVSENKSFIQQDGDIVLTEDVAIDNELNLNIKLTRINLDQEIINNKININERITLEGKAYFLGSDLHYGSSFSYSLYADYQILEIKKAKAAINHSESFSNDGKIDINKELKELIDEGLDISFTNSDFAISMNNPSPVNIHLTGDLAFFNDNGNKLCSIELEEDDNIVLDANSNTIVDLGEKFEKAFASIPELPSSYQANLNVKTANEECVEIIPDNTYNLEAMLELNTGISIKSTTDYTYSTKIEDLEMEDLEEIGDMFDSIELKFNAISTMPVDIAISSSVENNSSIQIEISDKIKAGTLSSPTSTPITIKISGNNFNIDNLLLDMRITGSELGKNVPINKNQGIELKDIQAKINGGITL